MPVDNCQKCGGSGWIFKAVDGIEVATRCSCDEETRSERFALRSGIPPLYANASTENYSLPKDNPIAHSAMQKVMINVRTYAREFPVVEKPGLLLIGETGVGKTHLAVAALNALIQRGFEGVFFDYQTLLDRIRSGYDRSSGSMDKETFRLALDCEILLLDDLGAHRVTDWVEDTVASIITHRCNHRKPVIVTTNLPAPGKTSNTKKDSLSDRIGARAWSRLNEMCKLVEMPAIEDYRVRTRR